MMSSEGWASEPSRAPWTYSYDVELEEFFVRDADFHPIASFIRERDARYACACINGELGLPKAMVVRYISAGTWLGQCHYCSPSHLLVGTEAMGTQASLHQHFTATHKDRHGHGTWTTHP